MKTSFLILLLVLASVPAAAQTTENQGPPVLNVTGNAQIRVAPDEATVRLGIVRQAPTAQAAQEQASAAAQAILNAITQLGVAKEKIQTSRLTLSPVYAPRSPESRDAPRIVAYHASNIISVLLDNLSLVGPAVDAGLKAGANQLEGVNFGLRNDLPARQQALKQAVTEAQRKAEAMAEALRMRLGPVVEISEGGVSVMPRGGDFAGVMMERTAGLAAVPPTPVSPGELEVHASVSIRYRIFQIP
ncbi:MAG: SIMPL domain-containing protein [Acidobacteria bacterium]|nr:SIMPL domain-containing protein [Acidobacteriota bacterium]